MARAPAGQRPGQPSALPVPAVHVAPCVASQLGPMREEDNKLSGMVSPAPATAAAMVALLDPPGSDGITLYAKQREAVHHMQSS